MTPAQSDRRLIAILSAGNFVIGMGAFVVIGILVPLGASFGISDAEAGLVMTVYAISYAVLSPILVALTGAIGRRRVLAASLALFALAALLSALAPTPEFLLAARVLAAAGAGVFTPSAAAVAAATSSPEERGQVLARVFFGLTLAQVIGIPAGSFIAYQIGWQWSLGLVALIALPCIWGIWTIVPSGLPFQPTRIATLLAAMRDWRSLTAITFTASFLGAIYVLYTYFAPLMEDRMGYEGGGVSWVLFVFGFGAVIGNLMGGLMGDRLGPGQTLRILAIAQVILMVPFSLLPMNGMLLTLLVFVWSVAGWSFMAPQQMRLLAHAGDRQVVVLALNAASIYVGAALGSAIGGLVIALSGVGALGVVGSLAALVALAHLVAGDRLTARG